MTDQSKQTTALSTKNAVANTGDKLVFIYAASNTSAQTALVSVSNLFANTANLVANVSVLVINTLQPDPANSTALTITQGTLFFSNSFGYYATSNNHVKRWSLVDF